MPPRRRTRGPAERAGVRPRGRRWWQRLLRALGLVVLLWVTLTVTVVLVFRFVDPPASSFMVQRMVEARWTGDGGVRLDHDWQPLARIAPAMRLAVVAAEDQKFPDHYGFDVAALREAAAEHLAGEGRRGASTISQQTAKNLFLWPGRSWVRKGFEAWFTVLIEGLWPKRRILEVYLNFAQFGRDLYGVEAAAQRYFGKPAAALTVSEAARLAAVLPAPNRYRVLEPSDHVRQRAAWIERQMRTLGGPAYLAPIGAD